jgi:hypothetical protein
MVTRSQEQFRENLRKSITYDDMRLMNSQTLARVVDADAVSKCRVQILKDESNLIKRSINRSEEYEDMERIRDKRIDLAHNENHIDHRQIGLDESIEKLYFDKYGEDFEGTPGIAPKPQSMYKCPCGIKYWMPARQLPIECSKCHRLTPIGRLSRDGFLKR